MTLYYIYVHTETETETETIFWLWKHVQAEHYPKLTQKGTGRLVDMYWRKNIHLGVHSKAHLEKVNLLSESEGQERSRESYKKVLELERLEIQSQTMRNLYQTVKTREKRKLKWQR